MYSGKLIIFISAVVAATFIFPTLTYASHSTSRKKIEKEKMEQQEKAIKAKQKQSIRQDGKASAGRVEGARLMGDKYLAGESYKFRRDRKLVDEKLRNERELHKSNKIQREESLEAEAAIDKLKLEQFKKRRKKQDAFR